jgi:hypothetical protein
LFFLRHGRIDFMTIASWLGHKDGGILIGKVYGHLLDEHRQKMAAKLTIGLAPARRALHIAVVVIRAFPYAH